VRYDVCIALTLKAKNCLFLSYKERTFDHLCISSGGKEKHVRVSIFVIVVKSELYLLLAIRKHQCEF